jgi:16S rRNA (cytidine1402-2'-O)-methyltransferase
MLALAASGLNGQQFAFAGYLPVKDEARAARVRELDAVSRRTGQTQIVIETPYRNTVLLRALIEHLHPATLLAVACALGWPEGWNLTLPVQEWRRRGASIDDRLPAVFAWQAA